VFHRFLDLLASKPLRMREKTLLPKSDGDNADAGYVDGTGAKARDNTNAKGTFDEKK
jgi:hypothetical protein